MNNLPDAPYLYLYVQSYCLASQEQNSQIQTWKEHFYAPNDEEARKLAQTVLNMKNARAVLTYAEASLERSYQDAHIHYFVLASIKARQSNGAYRAIYQH